MITLRQRYEEITALVNDDALEAAAHGASMEGFIMAAAELLGFDFPTVALSLEYTTEELVSFYGNR